MIVDEATSAMDTQNERLVKEVIECFDHSHCTVVIAHRLSTVVNADLICVMEHGQIVQRGTHQDLLERHGHYASLWQEQTNQCNFVVEV